MSIGILLAGLTSTSTFAGAYGLASQGAIYWLEQQQDVNDGSWPDSSAAHTFLQTAEVVLALQQLNKRGTAYYAGQTWLENHAPPNLDARARRLQVIRAAQSSTQQDISALLSAVSAFNAGQTGWGLSSRYQPSALDTALALDALRVVGANFPFAESIAYLKATQLLAPGDQGWAAATNKTTDPYITARVVYALAPYQGIDPTLTAPLLNAINTLHARVNTLSDPHLRAVTALALLRVDPASTHARLLLDSLISIQRADGGFDAGILTTGLIAQAMVAAEATGGANDRERVDVPDAALRAAINAALGRGAMDLLNRGDLARLTSLDISNMGVASLSGLEYAINLASLYAANNMISNISPISALTNLAVVDLNGNPCPGCSTTVASNGDVPIPLWATVVLAAFMLMVICRNRAGYVERKR